MDKNKMSVFLNLIILMGPGFVAIASGQEQLLMVTGGDPFWPDSKNVTLLSLDGGPPVPECLQNLNPHPRRLYDSCSATLGEGKIPHICGGRYWGCDVEDFTCTDRGINDECYRYNPELDTWTVSGVINPYKDEHSACAFNSVPELIMNGGCDGTGGPCEIGVENSTIYTRDGETFVDLAPMPIGLSKHCMVALDGDDMFVTGGYKRDETGSQFDSNKSYLYHSDTMEWEELPGLPTPRAYLMCGMVHNANGDQEVIAAGGGFSVNREVEIYNLQSGEWRTGNPLPLHLDDATVVPLDESFLLVGGYLSDDDFPSKSNTIYKYEKQNDSWTLLDTKIPFHVANPIALMVDIDIFPLCSDEVESSEH